METEQLKELNETVAKKAKAVLRGNNVTTYEPCAICGMDHEDAMVPEWIFMRSEALCFQCAKKESPELLVEALLSEQAWLEDHSQNQLYNTNDLPPLDELLRVAKKIADAEHKGHFDISFQNHKWRVSFGETDKPDRHQGYYSDNLASDLCRRIIEWAEKAAQKKINVDNVLF